MKSVYVTAAQAVFLIWGLAASTADIKSRTISVRMLLVGAVPALFKLVVKGSGIPDVILSVLPGCFFLLLTVLTRGSVGAGDGWFLIITGLLCGFSASFQIMTLSVLSAALFGAAGLITGKMDRRSRIPLIPFLTAACALIMIPETISNIVVLVL